MLHIDDILSNKYQCSNDRDIDSIREKNCTHKRLEYFFSSYSCGNPNSLHFHLSPHGHLISASIARR